MEIFRRLGLAKKIRNSGLPAEYRNELSVLEAAEIAKAPLRTSARHMQPLSDHIVTDLARRNMAKGRPY